MPMIQLTLPAGVLSSDARGDLRRTLASTPLAKSQRTDA
jgi:hypothetical protein